MQPFLICLATLIGMIAGVILVVNTGILHVEAEKLKLACEISLPRNQICIMQYIAEPPKEVSDG